tara:strand:- start:192 stop:437 length:246 start_codon:yes stop_codon:yes gene_type:complete
MVSELEIKRTIKKTKKNEQWTASAKLAFKDNVEALMIYLATRSVHIKQDRWDKSQQRVISNDVNAAFGEIWPELFKGENNE